MAGDLRDGLIRERNIPTTTSQANPIIGAPGSITAELTLPLVDPNTGVVIPFAERIVPTRSYLAYEEGGIIHNAGPIWNDHYDFDTRKLTLNAAGLSSIFDYRLVMALLNDLDPNSLPPGADLNYSGASLRTFAKWLVQLATSATGGELPIDYESDFVGDAIRTYLGGDTRVMGEVLKQISGVIGGPDIAFRPYLTTDKNYVRWNMLTGDPLLSQAGPAHIFDTRGPAPAVKGASISRNGAMLRTTDYEVGETPEDSDVPLFAKSHDGALIAQGYPRMESAASQSSVTTPDVLQSHADAATAKGRFYQETWSFQVRKTATPALGTYREGDYAIIKVKDNPRVPDGPHEVRILAYTTKQADQFATVTCAPKRVSV